MVTFVTSVGMKVEVIEVPVPEVPTIVVEAPGITRTDLRLITVFVDNGLDQDVTIQIKANRVENTSKAVDIGSAFTVSANSTDARSLSVETSGWLPYLFVEVQCSVAPTSGSLSIYRVRSKDEQVALVNSLEIRDTNVHNPNTDPEKVLIQEW